MPGGIYSVFNRTGYKPPKPKGPPKGVVRPAGSSTSTPATTVPPFDAAREASLASSTARRTQLLSDADVDMQSTAQQYGFKYDPSTGAFGGFDPTNPFSQAALLARTRDQHVAATTNSYNRRNNIYSGAYQEAQKDNQYQYDRGYDTLRRGFDDYVKRYLRRRRDIQTVAPEELATL